VKFVTQDYYEILNVAPGATNEEVKRAYRLVRESFRPDSMAIHSLYSPEETEAISAKIDEAFRILSDPELARRYAKYHRSGRPGYAVPRDPDVFFDQVHDLDGPSPIEQLARQLGRLSEVRRRTNKVAEEPVPVALRSLPPEPRYNPSPVSHVALPAVTSPIPEQPAVVGDPIDTAPAADVRTETPVEPLPAIEPVMAPAAADDESIHVLIDIDSQDAEELESVSVLAEVEVSTDDEGFFDDDFLSMDDEDDDIASLPASAFLGAVEDEPPVVPLPMPAMDPSLQPLPGAQVSPIAPQEWAPVEMPAAASFVEEPVARPVFEPMPAPPAEPVVATPHVPTPLSTPAVQPHHIAAVTAQPVAPQPVVASAPQPVVASAPPPVVAEAPVAAATPVQPTPQPQLVEEQSPVAMGALARRVATSGPRRWDRDSIRKNQRGPLTFTPLSKETIEAIHMDMGGYNGAFIQAARRQLEVAVKDISDRTKISVMMLRYIEADDIAELPAKVYLKGYLTQVARLLKLPVKDVVQGYLDINGVR